MEDTTSKGSTTSSQASITPQKLAPYQKVVELLEESVSLFQANSFTGRGAFSIPIPIPPCRNFSPSLSVNYSSGSGNGVFGIGFNVSIASIIRKTSKKVPTYNDEDVFVLTGADDLVPTHQSSNSEYDITYYQPRVESLFAKIERLRSKNSNQLIYTKKELKEYYIMTAILYYTLGQAVTENFPVQSY